MDAQELIKLYASGRRDFAGHYLRGEKLYRACLAGIDLREGSLQRSNMSFSNLSGANLQNAYLGDTNLQGARLEDADMRGAYLGDANLRYATLVGVDLRGASYDLHQILQVYWTQCSDEMITELMRWDAWFHPLPEEFQEWADRSGGMRCPCIKFSRMFVFDQSRDLFQAGPPTMSPMELWVRLCKEHQIRHDFEEVAE